MNTLSVDWLVSNNWGISNKDEWEKVWAMRNINNVLIDYDSI